MAGRNRASPRRGVLMLLVLGLLAMFGMVAIAFVIITGQFRQIAETHRRIDEYRQTPEEEVQQVALAVFRGDESPTSAIGHHSLLEDLYGQVTIGGQVEIYVPPSGNVTDPEVLATKPNYVNAQIFEITVKLVGPGGVQVPPYRLTGRVITFLGGTCAGISTRIVGARQATLPNGTPLVWPSGDPLAGQPVWRLQLAAEGFLPAGPDGKPGKAGVNDDGTGAVDDLPELAWPNPGLPNLPSRLRGDTDDVRYGDPFVINGTPFSGTGFGCDPATGRLDATVPLPLPPPNDRGELALLPNHPANRNPTCGANEDYDAPDYQNMALALVLPDGRVAIPSYLRPELCRYWFRRIHGRSVNPADPNDFWNNMPPDLVRWICPRPSPLDHPQFTGSNPFAGANPRGFNPVWDGVSAGFSWDVDNDGDGRADSIWVDVGLPARALPDGRMYKPLAAILVVDLDGRLNLNAHGALAQTYPNYYGPMTVGALIPAGEPPTPPVMPRGQGWGPAEVNLLPLLVGAPVADRLALYRALLCGVYSNTGSRTTDGRYGEGWRMRDPANFGFPAPGISRSALPDPFAPQSEPLFYNKFSDYPEWYPAPGNQWASRSYGSLPDLKGSLAMAADLRGQPMYDLVEEAGVVPTGGNPYRYALTNTPYELNLGQASPRNARGPTSTDHPFSVYELERLLRMYDADRGGRPDRLDKLGGIGSSPSLEALLVARRHEVTVESWDLPVPGLGFTPALRQQAVSRGMIRPEHVADLLRAKLPPGLSDAQVQALARQLLPWDTLLGQRMDLNRRFGNGRDDNNNGVVDEWEEALLGEPVVDVQGSGVLCNNSNGIDVNNDGIVNQVDRALARQLYARHLYVLMSLLADDDVSGAAHPAWTDADARARWIAQWAVNVVDFRDRDSVMTYFEYDPDPFTSQGWRVDGDPATDDGISRPHVVWGCERPELLITETLALHARRTEDLASDPSGKKTTDTTDPDEDFDQRLRPLASLFVELYNPWPATLGQAGEFCYDRGGAGWVGGILLNQRTPQGHPVWRLVVTPPVAKSGQAEDPIDPDEPNPADQPDIERWVYFTDPTGLPPSEHPAGTYWTTGAIAPLLPNRYAVVGPGDATGKTEISRPTNPTDPNLGNKIRQIVLAPNVDPNVADQVQVRYNSDPSGSNELPAGRYKPPVAVLIDQPPDRRMSVTEPPDGYTDVNWDPANQVYNPPYDEPFDQATELKTTGMTKRYKVVHLQRLANPLEPFDPVRNPYRTVDSCPVDLFAYNGWDPAGDAATEPGIDVHAEPVFHSRERGDDAPGQNNVWRPEPYDRPPGADQDPLHTPNLQEPPPPNGLDHCFKLVLQQTLGYLNRPYFVGGNPDPNPRAAPPEYIGDPPAGVPPFPMLTWNNRPFASPLELLLVPTPPSSRLLGAIAGQMLVTNTPYTGPNPPPHSPNWFWENGHYSFLANHFHSVMDGNPGGNRAAQLFRLLDLVHVPSPFVGVELQMNPATAVTGVHNFYPPFHFIPTYREPGRINLNTIFSPDVWAGLMNDLSFNGTDFQPGVFGNTNFFQRFLVSRRGYGAAAGTWDQTLLAIDDQYPSRFSNPFRTFAGATLRPPILPAPQGLDPNTGREINATLLREDLLQADRPLFAFDAVTGGAALAPYNDPNRNPYFRYQQLQRLGSLVSTRSNVYAVWITVGYFEVTPWPAGVDAVHPDGLQLGQELGYDSGEVRRHRAFYIFDRSIPVGFERGKNHNVHKAVLLERYIE